MPLPAGDVRDLYRYGSLDEFLDVFWLVQSVLHDRSDWERLGYESVLDGAAAGRVYAEVFVTPARHLAAGQTLGSVLEGLSAGLAAGDAETGCETRVIVNMDRGYGGEAGLQLMTELIELRRAGAPGTDRVIGIGMDSTELNVDPLSFAPAYREAAAAGLRRTGHQGQNSPAAAVGVVAVGLGAERIDHGLSLIEDPDLVGVLRRPPHPADHVPDLERGHRQRVQLGRPPPAARAARGGRPCHAQHRRPGPHRHRPGPRVRQLRGGVALGLRPDGRRSPWTASRPPGSTTPASGRCPPASAPRRHASARPPSAAAGTTGGRPGRPRRQQLQSQLPQQASQHASPQQSQLHSQQQSSPQSQQQLAAAGAAG